MKGEKNGLKFLLDFLPIVLFFIAYNIKIDGIKPIILASFVGGVATALAILTSKLLKIKLEKFALYSNIAFVFFAGLTVIFDNPNFIKAKLSILNGVIGLILFYFYLSKKPLLKAVFQGKIEMEDKNWNILNIRFSLMFFAIAILNFYFWIFESEQAWVNFKTFGVMPFIFIYFFIQFRFILKNGKVLDVDKKN